MSLYLLHFDPRYRHAQHYLGFANDVTARVVQHAKCGSNASPLVRAALRAGSDVRIARTWPTGDRTLERRLKRQGGLSRQCPICRESGTFHH